MSVSKDPPRKTWKVYLRYTDWQGIRRVHTKRGFPTKREGEAYEREFLQSKSKDINMSFTTFVECYLKDKKPRIRQNTYLTKKYIIEKKLLPYFGEKRVSDISAADIIQWQNEMVAMNNGSKQKKYSQTYLRTLQNQLSAIMNHACKYYGLGANPSLKTERLGKKEATEMQFWTKEEYLRFSDAMMDKPISFYAFEMLYCHKGSL